MTEINHTAAPWAAQKSEEKESSAKKGLGISNARPHPVIGVADPQLSDVRRVFGDEDFEPVGFVDQSDVEPLLEESVNHLRRLRDAMPGLGDTGADLSEVAELLRRAADIVEAQTPDPRSTLARQWSPEGTGGRRTNPVGGKENVLSPPFEVFGNPDGSVSAEVTLGLAYQGPPGCVHGGVSALMLDHMFGNANHWMDRLGMTVHYELDYRAPTPLFKPLQLRAWVDEIDGRKTWVRATIESEGTLCVEARALFLTVILPDMG